jgi:hypothetical protein
MGGAIGCHASDGLHNRLDPDSIEVRIQIVDQAPLGVRVSDASDLPTVGYLLEVLFDWSPFRATMQIRLLPSVGSLQALALISR